MRKFEIVMFVVAALIVGTSLVLADPVGSAAATTAVVASGGINIGSMIWAFMNSPVGLSVVGFILTFILGKVFTAKPEWKKYMDKYRPLLISAVKKAEKAIDDDTQASGLARLDWALNYVIKVEGKLNKASLSEAITAIHADAEKDGNL